MKHLFLRYAHVRIILISSEFFLKGCGVAINFFLSPRLFFWRLTIEEEKHIVMLCKKTVGLVR